MTPDRRPTRLRFAAFRLAFAGALLAALPALAQADWIVDGALAAGDPTYRRAYLSEGSCFLSSVGTAVYYDVHELLLDDPAAPADVVVSLCNWTYFDSVAFLYQWPDGRPGPFSAASACSRLVAYDDDFCGSQSQVASGALVPGHLQVVVTSFANGTTGNYTAQAASTGSPLEDLVFYSGFEPGDSRTWSYTID